MNDANKWANSVTVTSAHTSETVELAVELDITPFTAGCVLPAAAVGSYAVRCAGFRSEPPSAAAPSTFPSFL